MASISYVHNHLDALCCRVKAQVEALEPLEKAFADQADRLRGHDEAYCLDRLRERLMKEIWDAEFSERMASYVYTQAGKGDSLFEFGLGLLEAFLLSPEENSAKRAAKKFIPVTPFGKIMIGIGAHGLPEDVQVFSISRYARDLHTSELDAIAKWEAKGYRLFNQEAFIKFLGKLRDEILQGKSRLPIAQACFASKFLPSKSVPLAKSESKCSEFKNTRTL
jgi:hypothetical protein